MKGFTLVEVLVAMALVLVTATGVVELMNIAGSAVRDARIDTVVTLAAQSKMAHLRADASAGPGGSLGANLAGYSDFVTAEGAIAGSGAAAPRSGVYERRWRISPAPFDPANTLVLQVVASRVGRPNAREVHLVSLLAAVGR